MVIVLKRIKLLKVISFFIFFCLSFFIIIYGFKVILDLNNKVHATDQNSNINLVKNKVKQKGLTMTPISTADNQKTSANTSSIHDDFQSDNQPKASESEDQELSKCTIDAELVPKIINNTYVNNGKKIACLTFDDGPSTTVTPKVLEVLKKYNVKATFFLIGSNIDKSQTSMDLVWQTAYDGNSIGNHTYSHITDYNLPDSLYYKNAINIDRYFSELDHTNNLLKKIIGQYYSTRIIRMPGGHMTRVHQNSANLDKFDEKLQQNALVSIDWNCSDLDTTPGLHTADQLVQNTISYVGNKQNVVLLMHDTYGKEETAKALPRIIEYLKSRGYEFKRIK